MFRFLLPFLLGYVVTGNEQRYLVPLPYFFFGNDVLQFADLRSSVLPFSKSWKRRDGSWRETALAASAVGTLLRGTDLGNDVLNVILGWFIGTEKQGGADCLRFSAAELADHSGLRISLRMAPSACKG